MPRYLYITRPKADAEQDSQTLTALGYTPWVEPLLSIKALPQTTPPPYKALIFTSANAVRLFMAADKTLPTYTVGPTTQAAAKDAGYTDLTAANGTGADLCDLIKNTVAKDTPLLLPRGEHAAFPLKQTLEQNGHTIAETILYTTPMTEQLSPALIKHIRDGHIAAITLYSKRTAQNLVTLLTKHTLTSSLKNTKLLSISPSVLEYVHPHIKKQNWRGTYSAEQPNKEDMLSLIKQHVEQEKNNK